MAASVRCPARLVIAGLVAEPPAMADECQLVAAIALHYPNPALRYNRAL